MEICKDCGIELKNIRALVLHVNKHHHGYDLYVLNHDYNGVRPLCKCGCGQETPWSKKKKKYTEYSYGHILQTPSVRPRALKAAAIAMSRPEVRAKNSERLKERWKNDEKFREHQKQISKMNMQKMLEHNKTPEARAASSQRKKDFWASEKGEQLREQMKSDEMRQKISEATQTAFTPEVKQRTSDGVKRAIMSGKFTPSTSWKNLDRGYVDNIWCDSGLEKRFVEKCRELNIVCERTSRCHRVQYGDGKIYIPDFYLPEHNAIIELKGRIVDIDYEKWKEAEKVFEHFIVLNKDNYAKFLEVLCPST